jgi:hypothetical protein
MSLDGPTQRAGIVDGSQKMSLTPPSPRKRNARWTSMDRVGHSVLCTQPAAKYCFNLRKRVVDDGSVLGAYACFHAR